MINLTINEIILLHEKLLIKTGGMSGIRDFNMLESAVYSVMQCFGEQEFYSTPCERAARLAFAIIKNHPFYDGNKRIGILVLLMTLKLNHITIQYTQQELILLGLSIADGTLNYTEIVNWIELHSDNSF